MKSHASFATSSNMDGLADAERRLNEASGIKPERQVKSLIVYKEHRTAITHWRRIGGMESIPSHSQSHIPCNSICLMEEKTYSQNRLRRGLSATDDKNAPIHCMDSRSAKHRPSIKFRSYKKASTLRDRGFFYYNSEHHCKSL